MEDRVSEERKRVTLFLKASEKEGLMGEGMGVFEEDGLQGFDIINYFSEIMVKYLAKDR